MLACVASLGLGVTYGPAGSEGNRFLLLHFIFYFLFFGPFLFSAYGAHISQPPRKHSDGQSGFSDPENSWVDPVPRNC